MSAVTGWFDSHCHVQDAYRPEGTSEDDALDRAAAAGVTALVCVGTDAESSRQALNLVGRVADRGGAPRAWATVGLHPHEASQGIEEVSEVLGLALSAQPGTVVAVGECGLDYHYDHSPRPVQREMFAAQIELARRHALALVVHTREAWDDTLQILGSAPPERVVFHCFTGGPQEARRCLDLGAYLSFSGIVTFKTADDVRDAARLCPLDRLMVETDAPFLAPVPHRGQTNEPGLVSVVGEALSQIQGISAVQMADSSAAAAGAVFGLDRHSQ